jgi:hypothetical protein
MPSDVQAGCRAIRPVLIRLAAAATVKRLLTTAGLQRLQEREDAFASIVSVASPSSTRSAIEAEMSSIHELRAELARRPPESTGKKTIVLGILGAFLAGGLLVFGWQLFPAATPVAGIANVKPSGQPEITIPASSGRLGQASSAPILLQCMSRVVTSHWTYRTGPKEVRGSRSSFRDEDVEAINAAAMYAILQAGKTAAMGLTLTGMDGPANVLLASKWGELAECVYNQDGAALCDRNNRALAVESVTNHVRNANRALADAGNTSANRHVSQLRALNERVMAALRTQLRDGVVIAADFGMVAPDEIKRAAGTTKPMRDVCAARRG